MNMEGGRKLNAVWEWRNITEITDSNMTYIGTVKSGGKMPAKFVTAEQSWKKISSKWQIRNNIKGTQACKAASFFESTLPEQLFEWKLRTPLKNLRICETYVLARAYPSTLYDAWLDPNSWDSSFNVEDDN